MCAPSVLVILKPYSEILNILTHLWISFIDDSCSFPFWIWNYLRLLEYIASLTWSFKIRESNHPILMALTFTHRKIMRSSNCFLNKIIISLWHLSTCCWNQKPSRFISTNYYNKRHFIFKKNIVNDTVAWKCTLYTFLGNMVVWQ